MLNDRERRAAQDLEAELLSDPAFARAARSAALLLPSPPASVVVGVAADGRSTDAVEWAAAEADAQQSPLSLVHAFGAPISLDPSGLVPLGAGLPDALATAAQALEEALDRARVVAPEIAMSARLVQGPVSRVLLDESRDARLLVVGARTPDRPRSGVRRLVDGSLRTQLAAAAECPVAVVHSLPGSHSGRAAPRIVVGIGPEGDCGPVLAFGFRAARQRGLSLTAVHAWTADYPADLEAVTAPLTSTEAAAHDIVERAVARWRAVFPDVPVTTEVVRQDPASALIAGSAGAALVVVGARRRGRLLSTLSGSVSRAVLHGANGPVAVVRHEHRRQPAAAPRRAGG